MLEGPSRIAEWYQSDIEWECIKSPTSVGTNEYILAGGFNQSSELYVNVWKKKTLSYINNASISTGYPTRPYWFFIAWKAQVWRSRSFQKRRDIDLPGAGVANNIYCTIGCGTSGVPGPASLCTYRLYKSRWVLEADKSALLRWSLPTIPVRLNASWSEKNNKCHIWHRCLGHFEFSAAPTVAANFHLHLMNSVLSWHTWQRLPGYAENQECSYSYHDSDKLLKLL